MMHTCDEGASSDEMVGGDNVIGWYIPYIDYQLVGECIGNRISYWAAADDD